MRKRLYLLTILAILISAYLLVLSLVTTRRISTTMALEPDIYFASVLQVGGIGSDIYSAKAYYIGDGTAHQEGWPNYLSDDYANVSFNTPFYIMYLNCKEGYKASVMSDGYLYGTSDKKPLSITERGFGIELKDEVKNTIAIKCEKKF